MVNTVVAAVMAFAASAALWQPAEIKIPELNMNFAPAAVNVVEIGNLPVPELPGQDPAEPEADEVTIEEVEPVAEAPAEEFYSEPQEDLPTPADEFAYSEMQPLGTYHITHYSLEECGNCIGAAEVPGGMVEGLSCAMPERWMLGHTVLIEGYGFFRVDDISPDGIADIFHYDAASAIGEDWQMVYLVD